MKIFFNGTIVTMTEKNINPEAIIVEDGLIVKLGSLEEIKKDALPKAEWVDLEGKTLLPGFIDPHSHMIPTSQVEGMPDLSPEPIGDVKNIADIKIKIKSMIDNYDIPKGQVIMARGYDHTLLEDQREITRCDLDEISTEHGIYVLHCSLHTAVVNSYVLDLLEIDENTQNPSGGIIVKDPITGIPNGVLEENAHIQASSKLMPTPSPEQLSKMFISGQNKYASYGITTVQDGGLNQGYSYLLKSMSEAGLLKLDVVGYQLVNSADDVENVVKTSHNIGKYVKGYKTGGIKVLLDGSPQAKTAWLSSPYHIVPEGKSDDYCGYGTIESDQVCRDIFEAVQKNKLQVLVHANGDQASEQYLNSYEDALKITKVEEDLRPVMIHAQTVREDQLDRMKNINMIPSFFCMHTYFWGDLHLNSSLGFERANRISPTGSALERDMIFTIHSDSPVLPPDMMLNIWTAVNRETRDGVILGENQRISVFDALKAVTINAAFQYGEEDRKGTIEEGKLADLAILDKNPLEIDKNHLRNIKVVQTYKEGNVIYSI